MQTHSIMICFNFSIKEWQALWNVSRFDSIAIVSDLPIIKTILFSFLLLFLSPQTKLLSLRQANCSHTTVGASRAYHEGPDNFTSQIQRKIFKTSWNSPTIWLSLWLNSIFYLSVLTHRSPDHWGSLGKVVCLPVCQTRLLGSIAYY